MGRYSKNLSGLGQRVFVGPANVEYTTDATYSLFIDNAVEGELGIFLDDETLKSDALAAGDVFFIAQKRDGIITKTPRIKFNEIFSKRKTAYDAPVKQITTIGYNNTSGDLGFDFSGASNSSAVEFAVEVRETTPGNQPFPIQEGRAVVTSSTADEYATLASIASQLNGDYDYEQNDPDRFVIAEILTDGTITEFVEDPTITNGSTTVTFAGNVTVATGAYIDIRGVVYKVATGVTAGTSLIIDRPYTGTTETIDVSTTVDLAGTVTYTSGTTNLGLRLTSILNESHFVVTVLDGLADAPITYTQAWKLGSGSGDSIVELEKEGRFFDGVGSTINAMFSEDYGEPTLFGSSTGTYDQYFIDAAPAILPSAASPIYEQKQIQRVIIAVPSSGTTPSNELTTVLGL